MIVHAIQSLATPARRTTAAFVITVIACIFLALCWRNPGGNVHAATKSAAQPVAMKTAAAVLPNAARLDTLRRQAANGEEFSNVELTVALLNRYDAAGNPDDLYEALVWIDRRWDVSDHTELVHRVVANYCGQRVVQWHRLCVQGE